MLWAWYSPWMDTLRLWGDVTHRYWDTVLPARAAFVPATNGGARRSAGAVAQPAPAEPTTATDESAAVCGLRMGDRRYFTHTVAEADLQAFAAASGDCNPLHMDESYAARTRFGGRIAHGMLSASFISAALATLGGSAATTIYVSQNLRFLRPVIVGDTITTVLRVLEVEPAKQRLTVETVCRNQQDEAVVAGEATVLLDPYPFAA